MCVVETTSLAERDVNSYLKDDKTKLTSLDLCNGAM